MEDVPDLFRRIIDHLMWTLDEEHRLVEEILLEDDNPDENEPPVPLMGVYEDLDDVLNRIVARFLQLEIQEMLLVEDEEFILDLVYARNDRHIDWRLELGRMHYLRTLEDPTFQLHFRMNRTIFERLIVAMGNHLVERGRLHRLRTEIDKCLCMSIWILANLDTFRSTGLMFGVSRSVVHFHYLICIEALRELAPKYIKWPSRIERDRIKRAFFQKTGYIGAVELIDGTLIRVTAPKIQRERYFDRHQSYSINCQAVCDNNLLYRDVYVGNPGSVHDTRVFQRSPLHDLFLEREDVVGNDEHILGDGGYDLTNKLIVPFRDNGQMTPAQRHFNYVHSSTRMGVERSFGRLRGKMRRLLKLHVLRFEYALDHIVSSFVLHNFILLEGMEADGICIMQPEHPAHEVDARDFEVDGDDEEGDAAGVHVPPERVVLPHPLLAQAKRVGIVKREALADLFFNDNAN